MTRFSDRPIESAPFHGRTPREYEAGRRAFVDWWERKQHELALNRLRHVLRLERVADPRPYFGLGRLVRPRLAEWVWWKRPTPWGWRAFRVTHRDAWIVLPLWLYWPVRAWQLRRNWMFDALQALGLVDCPEAGWLWEDVYPTAPRWLWCFLNDRDHV